MTTLNKETPADNYEAQMERWERARFAPPPARPLEPLKETDIQMVAMRDGVRLYTEIFLPVCDPSGTFPVVLIRSPYQFSKPSLCGRESVGPLVQNGYAVVFQLCRGQGESEGIFRSYFNEAEDGFDTIAWVADQSWCNGKVGMSGASYLGSTQLYAAREKPHALKCIMPTAFVGHHTRVFPYNWGVPMKSGYMQWHQLLDAKSSDELDVAYGDMRLIDHPKWSAAIKKRPIVDAANDVLKGDKLASYKETIAHPGDDAFWVPILFSDDDLAAIDIPVFMTDGWYDVTIGPIEFFSRMEKLGGMQSERYLLVGPWNHYQTGSNSLPGDDDGDRVLPENGAFDMLAQKLAFFDRYLKDDQSVLVQGERVKVYITGVNEWRSYPTFPVPGTAEKQLYLHSGGHAHGFPGDGTLDWEKPSDEPVDRYLYDPAVPPNYAALTSQDRRSVEVRADVLTYTTDPLTAPLTILGDMTLVLHASSDATDTDWFAAVTEVTPDGVSKSFHYAPIGFRARYREGLQSEVFLVPNKPEEFRISLGPAGHRIAKGNRLRLLIFSASFPQYECNSNMGRVEALETETRIAKQTIYHDAIRCSRLLLPIVNDSTDADQNRL